MERKFFAVIWQQTETLCKLCSDVFFESKVKKKRLEKCLNKLQKYLGKGVLRTSCTGNLGRFAKNLCGGS